jgi:hypothetical protein
MIRGTRERNTPLPCSAEFSTRDLQELRVLVPELLCVAPPILGYPPQSPAEATVMQRFAVYVLAALLLGLLPLLIAGLGAALAMLRSLSFPSPSSNPSEPSPPQQPG